MRLWTCHTPEFSLTEGRVNYKLSPYYRDPDVPNFDIAMPRLWEILGTDQLVWCCVKRDQHSQTSTPRVKWEVEVPECGILRFVDDHVWNRILGKDCPPLSARRAWQTRATQLYPNDDSGRDRYVREQREEYRNEEPPVGGWWSCVFVDNADGESVSALIRHPVSPEWVKSREPFHYS